MGNIPDPAVLIAVAILNLSAIGAARAADDDPSCHFPIVDGPSDWRGFVQATGGQRVGPVVTASSRIFTLAEMTPRKEGVTPWKRVLRRGRNGRLDIIDGALATPGYLEHFVASAPYMTATIGLIHLVRPGRTPPPLAGARLITFPALADVPEVLSLARQAQTLYVVDSLARATKLLEYGTFDYMISSQKLVDDMTRSGTPESLRFRLLPEHSFKLDIVMLVSPLSSCVNSLDRLNEAIRQFRGERLPAS